MVRCPVTKRILTRFGTLEVNDVGDDDSSSDDAPELGAEAELDRVRQQLEEAQARTRELEAKLDDEVARPGRHRVRGAIAAVLLVLGTILTPISIVGLYAKTQVTDTDRYVALVTALAADPDVKAYLADELTRRILATVDVQAYVADLLPPRAAPLAGPVTSALGTFVRTIAARLLDSDAFQAAWQSANRIAHSQINALLTGRDNQVILADRGTVYLDLNPIIRQITQQMIDNGISLASRIPLDQIQGRVALFKSTGLYKVRTEVRVGLKVAWFLPFLTIALLLASAWLSRDRRRGLLRAAAGFAIGALILAIGLAVGRGAYLDALTGFGIPSGAAAVIYDTLLEPMHRAMRVVLSLSIVVLLTALLAGPSRPARWLRDRVTDGVGRLGRITDDAGWAATRPVAFIHDNIAATRIAVGALAFVVLFIWNRPTGLVILGLAVVAVLFLLAVEFYGRPRASTPSAAPPTPVAG